MGRKKRAVHPWSSRELALAECIKALGEDVAREGVEAFRLGSEEAFGYRPNSDEFIPWVADLLSAIERRDGVRITGGLATLLSIASGGRPLTSEDRFELDRKTWDEAIRRARKRVRFAEENPQVTSVRRIHQIMARFEARHRAGQARRALTPERLRVMLEFDLEDLNRDAQRLPLRDLKSLVRKIERLREHLRGRPRG